MTIKLGDTSPNTTPRKDDMSKRELPVRLTEAAEIIRVAKVADPLLIDLRDLLLEITAKLEQDAKRIAELEAQLKLARIGHEQAHTTAVQHLGRIAELEADLACYKNQAVLIGDQANEIERLEAELAVK
jgi:hypothetical protein